MGDFNEVHVESERYGSVFHPWEINIFNSFIANVGLFHVPRGGYLFTWANREAIKMSN